MADQQALHSFSQWVAGCSGDEKQEAQTFVQKLFTAWGWEDATGAGVSSEHRIPKGGAGGGMGFAAGCIAVTATAKKPENDDRGRLIFSSSRQAKPILQQKTPKNLSNPSLAFLCVKPCQAQGY